MIAWAARHRRSLLIATPVIVAVCIVHAWGMSGSPGFVDDEGTYTAQAWAVQHWGQLAHYTYWYDHPPLGWIQIASWTWLTDAFGRLPSAMAAGREAMLVAKVVATVLLFVLCRRLGLRRGFALLAVAIYGLSPLAIAMTRSVYLDNVAVPWLLGAFVLALSPRRHLLAAAASGLCFAIAVLSKETTLVLLPAWAWMVWQHADRRNRRFVMTLAMSVAASTLAFYPLVALLRGEFVGGGDRVSLIWAIRWQLLDRASSGSILDPASAAHAIVDQWLGLDGLLLIAGLVATVPALMVPRLRPIAAVMVLQVVMLLRGGYLPFPFVIVVLPFAAVVVAGVLDAVWARRPEAVMMPQRARHGPLLAMRQGVASGVLLLMIGGPSVSWPKEMDVLLTTAPGAAMEQAVNWVDGHVDRDDTIVVHDAAWTDLIERGFSPKRVVWFYKLDLDPGVRLPHGWRDIDYLVITESMPNLDESPTTRTAIEHSTVAASFGHGDDRWLVLRVGESTAQRPTMALPEDISELAAGAPAPALEAPTELASAPSARHTTRPSSGPSATTAPAVAKPPTRTSPPTTTAELRARTKPAAQPKPATTAPPPTVKSAISPPTTVAPKEPKGKTEEPPGPGKKDRGQDGKGAN